MNIVALPAALAFTMNLTLSLIVLSSNPKNIPHRLFACFVLSFATWNIGEDRAGGRREGDLFPSVSFR